MAQEASSSEPPLPILNRIDLAWTRFSTSFTRVATSYRILSGVS